MIKAFKTCNTRLYQANNLVFLVFFIIYSCADTLDTGITIVWKNNKAAGISIPKRLFTSQQLDSLNDHLRISLSTDEDSTAILGDLKAGSNITFEPLLPFSRGSNYGIFFKNKKICQFNIPAGEKTDPPELIACYPQQDTFPENLLKIYLVFSHPMIEGLSDKYMAVTNGEDTLHNVFLNLQPELWNEDRTAITVWLDPGRIKRDLQPNLRLGTPLKNGERYRLIVSREWKDAQGVSMAKDFTKLFVAGTRDSTSPEPTHWNLELPEKNSDTPLHIIMNESLDHFLLLECIHIKNDNGNIIKGTVQVDYQDKKYSFLPATNWIPGNYSLIIESRLEDLAGNNLNRPFDRDITQTKLAEPKDEYVLRFQIR